MGGKILPPRRAECCRACTHFTNDPAELERALPGLLSLSSAAISARADDGLCRKHGRYLGSRAWCADFTAGRPGPGNGAAGRPAGG